MSRATITILASNPLYIESAIKGAISQTYDDCRIIVRDDKQSDEIMQITELLMRDCDRLSYVRNERNLKELGSWFEAVKSCDTEFLLAAHDDDILYPSIVEEEIRVFDYYKNVVQVTTDMVHIDGNDKVMWAPQCDNSIEVFKVNEYIKHVCSSLSNCVACPTLMVRVASVREYVLNKEFRALCADDLNRSLLINSLNDIGILHKCLCKYRIHRNQASFLPNPTRWDTAALMLPLMEQVCGFSGAMKFESWFASCKLDCVIIRNIHAELLKYYMSRNESEQSQAYFSFLARVLYIKKAFCGKKMEVIIWGAGSAGIAALEMIRAFLPSYTVSGFIDSVKHGTQCGLAVNPPDDGTLTQGKYIFVCIGGSGAYEVMGKLLEAGKTMGEDFIGGYGVNALIDFDMLFSSSSM